MYRNTTKVNRSKRTVMKGIFALSLAIVLISGIAGCAQINNFFSTMKGQLVGNNYTIMAYDDFGNQILTMDGKGVDLEMKKDTSGNDSSYLAITINGREWDHVGNTLVFLEDGIDLVTDFSEPIEGKPDTHSSGLMAIDRKINNYRNKFGQDSVVAVYSQAGVPICILQGDKCYKEVPGELQKITRLNIDGKSAYVYRANIDIIPTDLLD